jgi:hypothetical protein
VQEEGCRRRGCRKREGQKERRVSGAVYGGGGGALAGEEEGKETGGGDGGGGGGRGEGRGEAVVDRRLTGRGSTGGGARRTVAADIVARLGQIRAGQPAPSQVQQLHLAVLQRDGRLAPPLRVVPEQRRLC